MKAPTDDLYRATAGVIEHRADEAAGLGSIAIVFARFNNWNRIRSYWEGDFMERNAPGAFAATIAERGDLIKVLYDHGYDPSIGNKVLGRHVDLGENDENVGATVALLDTSYNRDLLPGIEAGLYGASFRFRVAAERWVEDPDPSDYNPLGLPERTIEAVELYEFGPVTFPADEGTSVSVGARSWSLTDHYRNRSLRGRPEEGRANGAGGAGAERGTPPPTNPSTMTGHQARARLVQLGAHP